MIKMVRKLVKKAKNAGHSLIKPLSRSLPPDCTGSRSPKTSRVIANAKMPSLKDSSRPVSFSSTFFDFSSAIKRTKLIVQRFIVSSFRLGPEEFFFQDKSPNPRFAKRGTNVEFEYARLCWI